MLFTRSVRNVVDSCVCEHLNDEQVQTPSLLQKCIIVRDGLAHLPDALTAGDTSDIACYLYCVDCSVLLSVYVYYVYDIMNKQRTWTDCWQSFTLATTHINQTHRKQVHHPNY